MSMNAYVRRLSDQTVVSVIPWTGSLTERSIELFLRGILRNLHEDYFVDAEELYAALGKTE